MPVPTFLSTISLRSSYADSTVSHIREDGTSGHMVLTSGSDTVEVDDKLTVKDYFEVKNSSNQFLFRVIEQPYAKQVIIPDELLVDDKAFLKTTFIDGTLTMPTENKIDFGNSWNSVRATINHESLKINKIEKFNGSILTLDSDTIVTGSLTVGTTDVLTEIATKQGTLIAGTDIEIVGDTINYTGPSYTFTSPLTESSGVVSIDSTANLSVNELRAKDYFEVKNSSNQFLFRVIEQPYAKQVIIPDELLVDDKAFLKTTIINGTLTMSTENKIDFGNSWNSVRATINHESLKINKIEKFNGSILTLDSDTIVTGSLTVGTTDVLTELGLKQDTLIAGTDIEILGDGTINYIGSGGGSSYTFTAPLSETNDVVSIDLSSKQDVIDNTTTITCDNMNVEGNLEKKNVNGDTSFKFKTTGGGDDYLEAWDKIGNKNIYMSPENGGILVSKESISSNLVTALQTLMVGSVNVMDEINSKQNTLTAGSNITIVGDTISATGGGTTIDENTDVTLNDLTCHNKIQVLNDSDSVVMNIEHQGVLGAKIRLYNDAGANRVTLSGETGDISCDNLMMADSVVGISQVNSPLFYHSSTQSALAESSTRKDYVDGLIATKQDTLTAGTDIEILGDGTINYIGSGGSSYTFSSPLSENSGVVSIDLSGKQDVIDSSSNVTLNNLTSHNKIEVLNDSDALVGRLDKFGTGSRLTMINNDGDDKISIIADNNGGYITATHNVTCYGEMSSPVYLVNGAQNTSVNACTRKDYVDGAINSLGNSKQNTITTSTDLKCRSLIASSFLNPIPLNDGDFHCITSYAVNSNAVNGIFSNDLKVSEGDGDGTAIIGKMRIGKVTSTAGSAGWAGIQNQTLDSTTDNEYSLKQNTDGKTVLNSKAGQEMQFRIDNITKWQMNTDGTMAVMEDVNVTNKFGKGLLGSFGTANGFGIANRVMGDNEFMIFQNNLGTSTVNCKSGRSINFAVNNVTCGQWSSGGILRAYNDLEVDGDCEVDGYIRPHNNNYLQFQQGNGQSYHYWRFNWASSPWARLYLRNLSNDNNLSAYAYEFQPSSDDRIKANETPIINALDTLSKIKTYNYDKYGNFQKTGTPKKESGCLVQQIHYEVPELRHILTYGEKEDDTGIQDLPAGTTFDDLTDDSYAGLGWDDNISHMNYNALIPWLIQGIKEQQAMITDLQNQIDELKKGN
jgi:hypothetical protein